MGRAERAALLTPESDRPVGQPKLYRQNNSLCVGRQTGEPLSSSFLRLHS